MKQLNKESRATRLLAAIIFGTESKMNVLSKLSPFLDKNCKAKCWIMKGINPSNAFNSNACQFQNRVLFGPCSFIFLTRQKYLYRYGHHTIYWWYIHRWDRRVFQQLHGILVIGSVIWIQPSIQFAMLLVILHFVPHSKVL